MAAAVTPTRHASKDPQAWASKITGCISDAVESILAAGMHLADAKKALPHGQWERMFTGHPEAVEHPVRFSVGTAQRLMKIASNPVLSKTAHGAAFPTNWRTLYELTKLEPDRLMEAIRDGKVTPEMERKDVKALRVPAAAKSPDGTAGEPKEEWVSLSSIFGSGAMPKSAADVVHQALSKMLMFEEITPDSLWAALEFWAVEYLNTPRPDEPQAQVIDTSSAPF